MDHKVKNVQDLYDFSTELYDNIVVKNTASAENMLADLDAAIKNLKENWKGIDAGAQIQKVISIYNNLIKVRNDLARLSSDSSKVAVQYRDIQNMNEAHLEELVPLEANSKEELEAYSDTRDTIDINPDAEIGKNHIDSVVSVFESFVQAVTEKYNGIMDNWLVGTGRDNARESFEEFLTNAESYKKTLNEVSESITNALKNYSF